MFLEPRCTKYYIIQLLPVYCLLVKYLKVFIHMVFFICLRQLIKQHWQQHNPRRCNSKIHATINFYYVTQIQKKLLCIFHCTSSGTKPLFCKNWQLEGPQVKMQSTTFNYKLHRRKSLLLFKTAFLFSPLHSSVIIHMKSNSSPSLSQMVYKYSMRRLRSLWSS